MIRPLTRTFGALGTKSKRHIDAARIQLVARDGLAARLGQQQRGGIAGAGHLAGGGEDAVVADDIAAVRVAQLVADANDVVVRADFGRRTKAAGVDGVAFRHDDVMITSGQDVRCLLDVLGGQHRGLGHESGNDLVRNGADRVLERLAAHARLDARGITTFELDMRLTVDIDQAQVCRPDR